MIFWQRRFQACFWAREAGPERISTVTLICLFSIGFDTLSLVLCIVTRDLQMDRENTELTIANLLPVLVLKDFGSTLDYPLHLGNYSSPDSIRSLMLSNTIFKLLSIQDSFVPGLTSVNVKVSGRPLISPTKPSALNALGRYVIPVLLSTLIRIIATAGTPLFLKNYLLLYETSVE